MSLKNEDRRLPVEDNWFEHRKNEIVYSFMIASAEKFYEAGQPQYFLKDKDFDELLPNLRAILGDSSRKKKNEVTKRTVLNAIEKYEGYIVHDSNKKGYTFPYNPQQTYKMVDKELLMFLCNTARPHVIKIYLYLCFQLYQKDEYLFSLRELKKKLGYKESNRSCEASIRDGIEMLYRLKLIDVETERVGNEVQIKKRYVQVGGKAAPYYVLTFVADKKPAIGAESAKEQEKIGTYNNGFVF